MTERLQEILIELGKMIDIPLYVDSENSCTLMIEGTLRIQIELEKMEQRLIVGAFIGTIPPGKFRENVLTHTLQANHLYPRIGTFGYNIFANELLLFETFDIDTINGRKLADFLFEIVPKAISYKKGIESGHLPTP